jgi:hypothetical protein
MMPLPEELKDYKHFLTMVMCDLSAGWKGLGYGRAVKQFELSCTCCDCKSDFLAIPNSTKCSRWCHERDGEWQCFHKHVATPEVLEKMECEAAELKAAQEVELSILWKRNQKWLLMTWILRFQQQLKMKHTIHSF